MDLSFFNPFDLCVFFLEWLGDSTGYTYVETCVIFNLWIQGGILLLSGLLPLSAYLTKAAVGKTKLHTASFVGLIAYATAYIAGFIIMLWHYHLPYQHAFDLCVHDLYYLVDLTGISYDAINLLVFVVLFCLLIFANVLWSIIILCKPRKTMFPYRINLTQNNCHRNMMTTYENAPSI